MERFREAIDHGRPSLASSRSEIRGSGSAARSGGAS
jgi:hypothetical protein